MALMPKKLPMSFIIPIFMAVAGCSNFPNNPSQKQDAPPVSDYRQDKKWLAAQAVKDSKSKEIKLLDTWSEKVMLSTARLSVSKEPPQIRKQRLSECTVVQEVIKTKRYNQSLEAYFQANEVQRSIHLPDNDGGIGRLDVMVENISNNLGQALKNCYAGGFSKRSMK